VASAGIAFGRTAGAIAVGFAAFEEAFYNRDGTAYARFDLDGFDRAVQAARTAFHTSVFVDDNRLAVLDFKDAMRTDGCTHAAAGTLIDVQLKSYHVF
jgi:hypothetical protein